MNGVERADSDAVSAGGTITALRPAGGGAKLAVIVDGARVATVDALRAHELDLRVGRELGAEELARIERAGQEGRAREMALRWLGARARSRAEIERRLVSRKIDREVARDVVAQLGDAGLIDDEAFARSRVAALRGQGAGPRLMEDRLRRAGVSRELAARLIRTELEGADLGAEALELARRRMARLRGEPQRRTIARRLGAYLARRGYGPEACASAVEKALREMDEEAL